MKSKKNIFLSSNTSWYLYNFRKSTIVELINQGYKPVCIAPKDEYSEKLIGLGAEFISLSVEGKSTNPFKEVLVIFRIFKILLKYRPLFVFNFTIKMNIYFGLCCILLKIPYSNNVSGLGTAFLHKGFAYSIAKKMYGISNHLAKVVFFQNEDDLNLFANLRLADRKSSILLPGSGVDIKEFSYQPLNKENSFHTFIMIARVIGDKGVKEFVHASTMVADIYPETRFQILGDWDISNKSRFDESIIKGWQSTTNVEFLGHQENVKPWIYKSDVIVLPSYREGMPRTVLEAASCGRPAIVSDVPGCRHAIKPERTGWLCEVKSSRSLADKILFCIELSHSTLEEHGKLAREHIECNFSDELVINQYIKLLESY